jgi:hypothetical protein
MPRTLCTAALALLTCLLPAARAQEPCAVDPAAGPGRLTRDVTGRQAQECVDRKSAGCQSCHVKRIQDEEEPPQPGIVRDSPSMHMSSVRLGCFDCHGGDPTEGREGTIEGSREFEEAKRRAHAKPRFPDQWPRSKRPEMPGSYSAANPERMRTHWRAESVEWVRFVNPGDLRVAGKTCVGCHPKTEAVFSSMMTHGAMLWGAALYNNGAIDVKNPIFGEAVLPDGSTAVLRRTPPPPPELTRDKGILASLWPLPRWEMTPPGNILRTFERGGRRLLEIGLPEPGEEPGRPTLNRLSPRGFGTNNRTDPVFLGLQKTRLLDPLLTDLGTNDHPGDYRSSGCTACHTPYANDRNPVHSGPFAEYGNLGFSATLDPSIPKDERAHPIRHTFTTAIPSSQCMTCHVHPGTNMVASYFGATWWDNETDGAAMYPKTELNRSAREQDAIERRNPEGSARRGLWAEFEFLAATGGQEFNAGLRHLQFFDFHGHGWMFRSVYKRDRSGQLLDSQSRPIQTVTSAQLREALGNRTAEQLENGVPGQPVHLKDIHLERGMHCVDCHFSQDNHGNGELYGETRNATEIQCVDCHGTITERAKLVTSGWAAPREGTDLKGLPSASPDGLPRFEETVDPETGEPVVVQHSLVEPTLSWVVPQVLDTVNPASARFYNERSALAKTMQKDGATWGDPNADPTRLAHQDSNIACFTCHTSWETSCFGCHLPMEANEKKPNLHFEGEPSRNWTAYNFEVLRDDVFMLGRDGTVTGRKVAPIRSACAVVVGSQNGNREWLYSQQQTVSGGGFAGTAFSPFVPHTVRGGAEKGAARLYETKTCTDCHVSKDGDNNAWMAMVLMQGTNLYNLMGRYAWVGLGEHGIEGVVVTEREEPQAVIGSGLHRLAYPSRHARHEEDGRELHEAYHHGSKDARSVQLRGEYLYVADGPGGLRVFDVANIDNKGFSERFVTAPVSPIGQDLRVKSKNATAVAAPSTLAPDPTRRVRPENEEQAIHPLYAYLYFTDLEEGLIVVGAATLLDGDPTNNFLDRALTFNPQGALDGAVNLTIAGHYAYVLCRRGLVVVDLNNPTQPSVTSEIGAPGIRDGRSLAVQFRYAFVADAEGLKTLDVSDLARPRLVPGARIDLADARDVYVARTYAYVAAGRDGLAIVDVTRPESPKLDQTFNAGGKLNDCHAVRIGMTNASAFAYVADGKNGLRVLEIIAPDPDQAGGRHFGFSPRPAPRLIATHKTHGPAIALSKGKDQDRAVDESGHQIAVFGRRGSRPFTAAEMRRLLYREDGNGELLLVADDPPGPASAPGGGQASIAPGPSPDGGQRPGPEPSRR